LFLVGILKVDDENSRIRRWIHSSEARIRGSVPKCHGSATLVASIHTRKYSSQRRLFSRYQYPIELSVIKDILKAAKMFVKYLRFRNTGPYLSTVKQRQADGVENMSKNL
jgi:hypothetical protein